MKWGFPFSFSLIFWFLIGILRFIDEEVLHKVKPVGKAQLRILRRKVAVCIAAHNEELVILKTLRSVLTQISADRIFIVSDGSSDRTAELARSKNCQVIELNPGRGKARALKYLLAHFKILSKYEYVLFVDADTILHWDYLRQAMTIFENDPKSIAIAAYALSTWKNHSKPTMASFYAAYRVRLFRLLQLFYMYGQTWKYFNVNAVVPGFASMYRTKVYKKLEVDTPGIWIEDFNLAFQIQKKELGRIAHNPHVRAYAQNPDNFGDYVNQVQRWNVGFLQTVKHHGIWPSVFWASLGYFLLEVFLVSVFYLSIPLLVVLIGLQYIPGIVGTDAHIISQFVTDNYITLIEIFLIFFVIDYLMSILVAITDKKYSLIFYGLGFMVLNYINSLIFLNSLRSGFFKKSDGKWTPPKRSST